MRDPRTRFAPPISRRKDFSPSPYGSKLGLGRRAGCQAIGYKILGKRDLHRSHSAS
jgi:hypothetical protein